MQQLNDFKKKYSRFVFLLIFSLSAGVFSSSLLWMPLFLLAVFFGAVDIFQININKTPNHVFIPHKLGVLGDYVVDSTDSYGLFIMLLGKEVFVDIKKDKQLKERESYAKDLVKNREGIEINLRKFIDINPEYKSKYIAYIGLHSKDENAGEVFWDPEGYTRIRGFQFAKE